jgi:hypothetical protein
MKFHDSLAGPLQKALSSISPNCKEASRLQAEALNRELPFSKRVGLRVHLLLCGWCRRYGRNIRFLRGTVEHPTEHGECNHSPEFTAEAKERLKQKLTNHQKDESGNHHH